MANSIGRGQTSGRKGSSKSNVSSKGRLRRQGGVVAGIKARGK